MSIQKLDFGKTDQGCPVDLYVLANGRGMTAKIMTLGGTVTELHVPDRAGNVASVTLGFDNLPRYLAGHPFFGVTVGRFANRIARGRFILDGIPYKLATNAGPNHLHGGVKGFDKVIWQATPGEAVNEPSLRLTYRAHDGEEGYPGNLDVAVTFTVTAANELKIEYVATTSAPTPVNLTNHSYFNLAGAGVGDVLGHELMLAADHYTPVDETLIPTGEIAPVKGTPMDFTTPATIGSRIAQVPGGYDHNYVLTGGGRGLSLAARVYEPLTGRVMEVLTTQPGVQLYTMNQMRGTLAGIGGTYGRHAALCLETQHFPDSVNQPNFPSAILRPGEKYEQVTVYRFSTR